MAGWDAGRRRVSSYLVESCPAAVPESLRKAPVLLILAFWSSMSSVEFAELMVQRQLSIPSHVLLSIYSEFFKISAVFHLNTENSTILLVAPFAVTGNKIRTTSSIHWKKFSHSSSLLQLDLIQLYYLLSILYIIYIYI